MLELTQLGSWRPPIVETVATTGAGVEESWTAVAEHRSWLIEDGSLEERRRRRLAREFHQILLARVGQEIDDLVGADRFADAVAELSNGVLDPYEAADRLLSGLFPPTRGPGG